MNIMRQVVVFDVADLAAESTFWAGVVKATKSCRSRRH